MSNFVLFLELTWHKFYQKSNKEMLKSFALACIYSVYAGQVDRFQQVDLDNANDYVDHDFDLDGRH